MSDMKRRDFVSCCAVSLCSSALVPIPVAAEENACDSRSAWLQSQLDSARVRYAKFIDVIGHEVDEPTKRRLLRALGRECALQYRGQTFDRYQGDIKGFLKAAQEPSGWVEKAEYDEQAGTIRIVDKQKRCSCPLVMQGTTPSDQCECTLGWQTETYSRILGRPVEAEVEESILRGGKRCVFLIRIKT
jgi:predicted hydrocarbon binding protein